MKFSLTNFIKYYLVLYFVALGIMYYLLITVTVYFIIFDVLVFALVFIEYMNRNIQAKGNIKYLFFLFIIFAFIGIAINDASWVGVVKRLRFVFYPIIFFYLLQHKKLNVYYYKKIKSLLFTIGYIQAPITIFQKFIYQYLPSNFKIAELVDYASGTIGGINSSNMGCFMVALFCLKIQEGMTNRMTKIIIIQSVILIFPLFIIQSEAQFIFLPIMLIYILYINKKLRFKYILNTVFSIFAFFTMLDIILPMIGSQGILIRLQGVLPYLAQTNISGNDSFEAVNRISQMGFLFLNNKLSLFGNGLGSFYEHFSYNTNLVNSMSLALNNQFLSTYAETGLIGLMILVMIPTSVLLSSNIRTHNSKTIKLLSFQILINFIYISPMYSFHLMFVYIYYYVISIRRINML
jgi:hypothetical protein